MDFVWLHNARRFVIWRAEPWVLSDTSRLYTRWLDIRTQIRRVTRPLFLRFCCIVRVFVYICWWPLWNDDDTVKCFEVLEPEVLVLGHDLGTALQFVKEEVGALLQAYYVSIRFQYHFHYRLVSSLRVVPFKPHIVRHNSQISKLFYHWEVLQFAAEVPEVNVVWVKLVLEIGVWRGLNKWFHSFLLFFFRHRLEKSIVQQTLLYHFLNNFVCGRVTQVLDLLEVDLRALLLEIEPGYLRVVSRHRSFIDIHFSKLYWFVSHYLPSKYYYLIQILIT